MDVSEVLGCREDAGDLEASLSGVVNRGGGGASEESLQLDGVVRRNSIGTEKQQVAGCLARTVQPRVDQVFTR